MGYIHDVNLSLWVPPSAFMFSAGTWTDYAAAGNLWSRVRTAADASFWIYVPIPLLSHTATTKGSYLKAIEFVYSIETAACDNFATVQIWMDAWQADGSPIIPTNRAATVDTLHDTAAERLAVDDHKMIVTLDEAAWIINGQMYHLDMLVDAAAATVFKAFGALVKYTLRL